MATNAKTDPHWVRDTMIEDYRNAVIRQGKTPNMRQIERVAMSDLNMCESVWKEQEAKPRPKPKRKEVNRDTIKADAAKSGMRFYHRAVDETKDVKDPFLDGFVDPKWQAAMFRISEICQPQSGVKGGVLDPKCRTLALEFILRMDQLKRRRGPFTGKSVTDSRRMFRRFIEDICDRSDSKFMRNWWVK